MGATRIVLCCDTSLTIVLHYFIDNQLLQSVLARNEGAFEIDHCVPHGNIPWVVIGTMPGAFFVHKCNKCCFMGKT